MHLPHRRLLLRDALAASSSTAITQSVCHSSTPYAYPFQNKSQIYDHGFPTNTHTHYLPVQHDNDHYTTDAYANYYGGVTYPPRQYYPPDPSSFQTNNNNNNNISISTPTQTQHAAIAHGNNSSLVSGQPSVPCANSYTTNGHDYNNHSDDVIVDYVASRNYDVNNPQSPLKRFTQGIC